MKKAEEYLNVWLGGNMNVSTLTPFAICEFARDYHNYLTKKIPECPCKNSVYCSHFNTDTCMYHPNYK